MLEGWLDFHRATLLTKCAGLTADQLRERSAPPSPLSLLGLVRHMADVERWWFRRNAAGEEIGDIYPEAEEFTGAATADAAADLEQLVAEFAHSRAAAAQLHLDDTFQHRRRGTETSVRWVFVHMIEEYARHNGHADLLRERIDGQVGD